ncbi:hypothetical protein A2548_00600 [candidate division WOR-1 bacterium RIFOXYD2_FULL_41_8]|nr:MAG: hypothetical protein A2548_00600 [candidate division WOR-1 bacterium RIFOXYD2_FULL_41_8]
MQTYLFNILLFCGVLLLIALTVAVILGIIMLIDVVKTTKQVKRKILALTSVLDVVTLFVEGMGRTKKRVAEKFAGENSTLVAAIAGLKRGLQVLLGKKEVDE